MNHHPRARQVTTLLLGVVVGVGAATVGSAYEAARSSRPEKSTPTMASPSSSSESSVESKLDQILATQEKILQRFDAVMEELRVIKVRASMQ